MSREDGLPARQGGDLQAIADAIDIQFRAQFARELAHVQSQTRSFQHASTDLRAQLQEAIGKLKVSDDKLKASDCKLRELDNSFQSFQADTKQSVEDLIAEYEYQKKEMARRFDAWTADGI